MAEQVPIVQRTYRIAADPDDDGHRFWQANRGADCLLEAWLAAHGVDLGTRTIDDSGWSLVFRRSDWT